MKFPALTICNLNKYNETALHEQFYGPGSEKSIAAMVAIEDKEAAEAIDW